MAENPSNGDWRPSASTSTSTEAPPSAISSVPAAISSEPAPARRSGRKWIVIGAIAMVFLVVIGYVVGGAAAAAAPVSRSEGALRTAVSHNNTIADLFKKDPFKDVDFKSDNPDVGAARAAAATVKQNLAQWQRMVTGDRQALEQARTDLTTSFLTLPEQGSINSHRHRVDAALSAMGDAQQAIDLLSKEMAFFDPFVDVIAGFEAISKAADAKDLGAMQSKLASTAASLQKAIDLAQPPALPTEVTPTLKQMQQLIKDWQAMVSAAQRSDLAAFDRYAAAIEADAKALDATDDTAVDNAVTALFKPLGEAYDREMKVAAGY